MTKVSNSTNIKGHTGKRYWHKLTGILLAMIGIFWFAKKIGWIPVAAGGSVILWPVLTIMFGLWLACGNRRRKAGH